MPRLISFFSEPFDGYAPSRPAEPAPPATGAEDPPYFLQLLASLKELRREKPEEAALDLERN